MKNIIKLVLLSLSFLIFSSQTFASESEWAVADEIQVRLISAVDSIHENKEIEGAIQVKQSPGWHSYWRSPGESGLAPGFNWETSKNIEDVKVFHPVPKRFDEMGIKTFGHDGDIMFPFTAKLIDETKPARLNLQLTTMVCNEICVPQSAQVSMELEKGKGLTSEHARIIDFAKTKVPVIGDTDNLKIDNITVTENAVVINTFSQKGYDRADIFLEIGDFAMTQNPEFQINDQDPKRAMVVFNVPENIKEEFLHTPAPFAGVDITTTLTNGREAIEQTLVIK